MNLSLVLAFLWAILANVIAMLPSKRSHWPAAYALIAVGLPILAFVYVENGPVFTAVIFLAGLSILRWPVRYLWRWVRRQFAGRAS